MDSNKFRVEFETRKILRLHDHVNIQELQKFRQRLVNITQILTRKQYPEKMDKTPIKNYKTYNIRCHFRR